MSATDSQPLPLGDLVPETVERPTTIQVLGAATPEETAALVAVLTAASGPGDPAPAPRRSTWAARERSVRTPLSHGPGQWRSVTYPR